MKRIILISIIALTFFLRFYEITNFQCMNWDEATFLFNAHSIVQTGRDEYGEFLPLQFTSVGDYKFPVFIYLLAPLTKIFGTGIFTVRLLPSLFAVVGVYIIYKLTCLVSKSETTAIAAAFLLAVSPWHMQFSRAGADVGVSTFFVIWGIYLLFRAHIKRLSYLPPAVVMIIAMYTYFGERIFVPLFIIGFSFYFRSTLITRYKTILKSSLIALALLIPAVIITFNSGHQEKLTKTTVLGYHRSEDYTQSLQKEDTNIEYPLFHATFIDKGLGIVDHYLNHFSPSFLFINGLTDPRQFIYGMGMLYLTDLPLILIGVAVILKSKNKYLRFVLLWLLIAPLPSAVTRDPVHARRAINMIYPLTIISAVGLSRLINILQKFKFRKIAYLGMTGVFTILFGYYLLSYFIFTPARTYKGPGGWNCGYEDLVEYLTPMRDKHIVVDTSYQGAYVYFLLYEDYPPEKYQPQAQLVQENPDSLGEGAGYDNYEFRPIYWPKDRLKKGTIFAGPPERLPIKDIKAPVEIIKTLYFPNGEVSWLVVQT